jgi:catechol 2,3-dioxygenase-like lactoylglutathione lyase family enzyme
MELDHLILPVNDVDATVRFFTDVLALDCEGESGPFTVIRVGHRDSSPRRMRYEKAVIAPVISLAFRCNSAGPGAALSRTIPRHAGYAADMTGQGAVRFM